MDKIKNVLFSEKGMKMVNLLFFLSLLIRNSSLICVAYAVWILYLLNCIKNTPSKAAKTIYSLFVIFTSIMIILNLYFLFKM